MENKMEPIKFVGIDRFNRPIFRSTKHPKNFFGSVDILFNRAATQSEVLSKVKEKDICYFGNRFGCEPMGTSAKNIVIVS